MTDYSNVAVVLIGRNEGERLSRCLGSIPNTVSQIVYVDSGSTDDSITLASGAGAVVVKLDKDQPFTAARARNAGYDVLGKDDGIDFVQFVDGDCELQRGWINEARDFLMQNPKVAVICGRRRERFPERSAYNRLCDWEWNTPVGDTKACGGDAMIRFDVFGLVGGFNPKLIAGEEPELCVRIRRANYKIWRLDQEMTLHDANMTRPSQWWNRARRSGHASAEGAMLYGSKTEEYSVVSTFRALMWGLVFPVFIVLLAPISGFALILFLAYPLQIIRLAVRDGTTDRTSWERAFLLTVGKFPEAMGAIAYFWKRVRKQPSVLIEYK